MNTQKLITLPLGSRFRYLLDSKTVYVLLDREGRGRIATAPEKQLSAQCIHAAAMSREEFESLRVEFVPVEEVPELFRPFKAES